MFEGIKRGWGEASSMSETSESPPLQEDTLSWRFGFIDSFARKPYCCPPNADAQAYNAGRVEGERQRRAAEGNEGV